jgi:hypothetical protein
MRPSPKWHLGTFVRGVRYMSRLNPIALREKIRTVPKVMSPQLLLLESGPAPTHGILEPTNGNIGPVFKFQDEKILSSCFT